MKRNVDKAQMNLKQKVTRDTIDYSLRNQDQQPIDLWYQQSYTLILQRFSAGCEAFPTQMDQWIERKAWVGSWLPTILKGEINQADVALLAELESKYRTIKIVDMTTDSLSTFNWEEDIYKFLEASDKILNGNGNGNWHENVSSTSKLMHFMCPQLFPIMDAVVCKEIISVKARNNRHRHYFDYFSALIGFLEEDVALKEYIVKISTEQKVSVLRIIDLVIFSRRTT